MKTVAVLSLALLAVVAADVDLLTTQSIRSKIIEHVNSANTTWVAGVNERFATSTYSDIQRLLGAYEGGPKLPVRNIVADNIPDSFDVRDAWSSCKTVHEVRDQSNCGSCWAFGATEAASDRVCIATNGTKQPRLSAEDLLSCCGSCGMGCSGGFPGSAWDWFTSTGVVTGGAYDDFSWCRAYTMKPCDHHTTGKYGPCPSGLAPTPSCNQQCDSQSTYSVSYSQDKYVFSSAYSVSSDPKAIQTELMTKGSVEAAFTVYADFESYTSGVYQHTTGSQLGGHAVKIVGWGVDNGTPYWTVANSWNTDWGEKGFFRIKRGNDECGIESGIVAGEYK